MADAAQSIKVVKSFAYRDETREFSNRYHMDGPTIVSYDAFEVLADNVVTAEAAVYLSDVTFTRVEYTKPGETITAFTKEYTTPGSLVTEYGHATPGDCAALVKYTTLGRTSRNHPIYLFNYYHAPRISVTDPDHIQDTWQALLQDYADGWISGRYDGNDSVHSRVGPAGDAAIAAFVADLVTHRDLPRRS